MVGAFFLEYTYVLENFNPIFTLWSRQVVLVKMEKSGRSNVREEARVMFEATMKKDKKAEGIVPSGPGVAADGEPAHDESEPALFIESLFVEGYKGLQG